MRLEQISENKFKQEILSIIGRHVDLGTYKVFVFGSRVLNKGSDRSDIDLGIEGPAKIPADAFFAIEEELEELSTLYTIELVDFAGVSSRFHEIAKEKVEYLN